MINHFRAIKPALPGIVVLLLCALPASGNAAASAQDPQEEPVAGPVAPGRALVKIGGSTVAARLESETFSVELAARIAMELDGSGCVRLFGTLPGSQSPPLGSEYGLGRWIILYLSAGETVADAVDRLSIHPLVEHAEPDYLGRAAGRIAGGVSERAVTPNDPLFAQQWYLDQSSDADIDMPEAWEYGDYAGDVLIAVLDSGVDTGHPDLEGALLPGWDFVNRDPNPSDDEGHGTNVAGLLGAAGDNMVGIAGVAFRARVIPIKILDEALFGYYSWWAEGFYLAAERGARVINISAGGGAYSEALHDAVRHAYSRGAVICAAMMNTDSDSTHYPAAFEETIAVGATGSDDRRASPFLWGGGSSFGDHIDIVAPGDNIISTYPGGTYAAYSGTSQATPLASGVAALMIQLNPRLDREDIRSILRDTTDDLVGNPSEDIPGFDIYHGAGRLNAEAALRQASLLNIPFQETLALPPRPNPARGLVVFIIDLTESRPVTLRIFDVRGRLIATPVDGLPGVPGRRTHSWDGTDSSGNQVPSGIYLYELTAGQKRATGKFIWLK